MNDYVLNLDKAVDTVLARKEQCLNSDAIEHSLNSAVTNVTKEIQVLVKGYLETNISENIISQCKQCSYGALLATQIDLLLNECNNQKQRTKMERSLKKELFGKMKDVP